MSGWQPYLGLLSSGLRATCLLAIATPSQAQDVPTWSVVNLEAKYGRPFDQIGGAVELSDGRLIVLGDGLFIVNLRQGMSARIGRYGNGPGEYRAPNRLLALRGDTTGYLDMALPRQLLFILPSGELRGNLAFRVGENVSEPQGADAAGGIYAQHYRRTGPRASRDSSDVVRWDRVAARFDTVGRLRHLMVAHRPPANLRPPPFFTFEQWTVNPDGRVAVVSVAPYRVTFFNPNRTVTVGPVIVDEQVRVSDAHRKAWLDEASQPVRALVSYYGGPLTWVLKPRTPDEVRVGSWPKVLPPFLPDAVGYAPDGMLWIKRTRSDPSIPTFDIIDREGRRAGRIVLPKGLRLLTHSKDGVYLVREDADGLQYLELYRLPTAYKQAAQPSR